VVTGSAAAEREYRWSDIDLAFGVRDEIELQKVIGDWTAYMYADHARQNLAASGRKSAAGNPSRRCSQV
jgi:hypothetical protein